MIYFNILYIIQDIFIIKLWLFGKDNPHKHSIDSSLKLLCESCSSWILVSKCKLL